MDISLVTFLEPSSSCPWRSTITISDALTRPLLTPVGVTSSLRESRRTERFPEVPGVKPRRDSHLLNLTSSRRNPSSVVHPLLFKTLLLSIYAGNELNDLQWDLWFACPVRRSFSSFPA